MVAQGHAYRECLAAGRTDCRFAFNAGDVDTMVGLYEEHAVLLPPGAPAANGQAAIRAFFAKMAPAAAKDGLEFSLGAKPAGGARGVGGV